MFLGVFKHVAHARGTDPNKHFDEIGARNREERHLRLTGDGLGQKRLTRPRVADEQNAFRNASAEFLELRRITQEIDELGHFFLGFVAAGNIRKRDAVTRFIKQPRLALAERECPALAAALHLAHEEHPHADQQKHREPADKQIHQEGLFFFRLGFDLDTVLEQVGHHPQIGRRIGSNLAPVTRLRLEHATFNHDLGDGAARDFVHELRIFHGRLRRLAGIELVEHGHQDETNDQPDRHILEHVIQC